MPFQYIYVHSPVIIYCTIMCYRHIAFAVDIWHTGLWRWSVTCHRHLHVDPEFI